MNNRKTIESINEIKSSFFEMIKKDKYLARLFFEKEMMEIIKVRKAGHY